MTSVEVSAPPEVMVFPAILLFMSMVTPAAVVVFMEYAPVAPVAFGFLMLAKVIVLAPAAELVPALLVSVTTWPATLNAKEPSMPEAEENAALATLNPEGKVMRILPSDGMDIWVVKLAVALPVMPQTRLAGTTLAEVNAPVIVQLVLFPPSIEFAATIGIFAPEALE